MTDQIKQEAEMNTVKATRATDSNKPNAHYVSINDDEPELMWTNENGDGLWCESIGQLTSTRTFTLRGVTDVEAAIVALFNRPSLYGPNEH